MEFGGTRGGVRQDVILVDTTWGSVDFLACQLARRGLRVHAFTPFLRWPRYLRAGYPYRSHVELPLVKGSSDAFEAMVERIGPACIIPGTEDALYWLWDQPGQIQRLCLPGCGTGRQAAAAGPGAAAGGGGGLGGQCRR